MFLLNFDKFVLKSNTKEPMQAVVAYIGSSVQKHLNKRKNKDYMKILIMRWKLLVVYDNILISIMQSFIH